jgi:hypothetical protein
MLHTRVVTLLAEPIVLNELNKLRDEMEKEFSERIGMGLNNILHVEMFGSKCARLSTH